MKRRAVPFGLALSAACYSPDGARAADGRGLSACVLPNHTGYPFCNTSLALDDRVRDLIQRIHDEDKPNLLTARGCKDCGGGGAGALSSGNGDGSSKPNGQFHQQALDYLGVPAYCACVRARVCACCFWGCLRAGRCPSLPACHFLTLAFFVLSP